MPEGTSIEVADLFYNLPARRKFLKSDGAESAQVSRIVTQLALCLSGDRLHADQRRPQGAAVSAGGVAARPAVPALRRSDRSGRGPARAAATSKVHRDTSRRWRSRGRRAGRRTSSSTGASSRTGRSRTRSSTPTASRRSRSAARRCTCSSRCRATRWTSTCTRRRRRSGSAISRYIHQVIRRTLADALGRGPAPELQLEPPRSPAPQPTTLPLPDLRTERRFPSRWTTAPQGPARCRKRRQPSAPVERVLSNSRSQTSSTWHSSRREGTCTARSGR